MFTIYFILSTHYTLLYHQTIRTLMTSSFRVCHRIISWLRSSLKLCDASFDWWRLSETRRLHGFWRCALYPLYYNIMNVCVCLCVSEVVENKWIKKKYIYSRRLVGRFIKTVPKPLEFTNISQIIWSVRHLKLIIGISITIVKQKTRLINPTKRLIYFYRKIYKFIHGIKF